MENLRCIWSENPFDNLSITSEMTRTSSSISLYSSNNFDSNFYDTSGIDTASTSTTSPNKFFSNANNISSGGITASYSSSYSSTHQSINDEQLSSSSSPSNRRRKIYCDAVSVESSGHVAQIVGKNGCKIKHLRAKYGTYIRTPSADAEPVFIIRGLKDNVLAVKEEIMKADRHFAGIKEARDTKILQKIHVDG
ncbi:hypothetical protein BLA29_004230 [Euroglyphus maynei]|uniref:K Homology domain-containing protein n=1 Tax=Euroglyphus maynei TaxID=6958 RepID=A0A1Y3ATH9_EURMA|nr:hypothetical protein BLA29_004230 [Euroglyphus maynei]